MASLACSGRSLGVRTDAFEVALGGKDGDDRGHVNILFERTNVGEVVDIKKDLDARHEQAELALDDGALVLPSAPDVRKEEMPALGWRKRQLRLLLGMFELQQGKARRD